MKRDAVTHTKMKRLCRRLDLHLWQAVGIMESIWWLASKETPRGDIGRLTDEDIALGIDYRSDERKLIEALVGSGWIDPDIKHRLVIHDWWEHCDDAVHMRLARASQFFVCGRPPKLTRLGTKEKAVCEEFFAHAVRTESTPPVPRPASSPPVVLETPASETDAVPFELSPPESAPPLKRPALLPPKEHECFDAFWSQRWRSRDKAAAKSAFISAAKSAAIVKRIMKAVADQRAEMLARPSGKRPYMSTWLNKEGFNDEEEPPELLSTEAESRQPADERRRNELLAGLDAIDRMKGRNDNGV